MSERKKISLDPPREAHIIVGAEPAARVGSPPHNDINFMKHLIHFTKMQGAGNDYIYLDRLDPTLPPLPLSPSELARRMSPRHTAVGADGLVLILPSDVADARMQMFNAEVTGITHDKIRPRISQTAKSLWLIYLLLTMVLILLLWAGPMNFFESVCHAFGAISTGGYSSNSSGIAAWHDSVYIKAVLIVFMFLGGVNFGLIYKTSRGDLAALRKNDVFRVYVTIIAGMLVLFAGAILLRGQYDGWQSVTIDPLFQIVSTITSTGFTVNNF